MIQIPIDTLTQDTLDAVLEEFASRDGTDYGEVEVSLAEKVSRLRSSLRRGDIVLVYDEDTESTHIVTRAALG